MSSDMNKFDEAAYYILKRIQLDAQPGKLEDIRQTLDVVERIVEVLRIKYRCRDNRLEFEEFIQGTVSAKNDILTYYLPKEIQTIGTGTASIRLQPKLLMYLLLYHNHSYRVYDIIDQFITKIWDDLEFIDFKKTKTGVTRCFTNTRFAAHTLRDYGFLKFTHKEAYKTWVLSLPGFLVASKVLETTDWRLPKSIDPFKLDLHQQIITAWDDLQTYDQFVSRLAKVCKPNVEVFSTFKDILRAAYDLLGTYWTIIRNENTTQKKRRQESLKLLSELEGDPRIEQFYQEFSACLNVEMLIQSIGNSSK